MRVKRQKRFRKTVRFYKACFGFREPFKVLCDGNFQHYVQQQKLGDIPSLLSQALGGTAKAFSTRCINAELKKLGKAYTATLLAGKNLYVAKCNHEPSKPGSDCLESLVANKNPDHFFVATQDVDLRRKCRIMPGCALIFSKKTSLFVEPPSEFQQQFSRADEAQRERLSKGEQTILEATDADQPEGPDPSVVQKHEKAAHKHLAVKDRPVFKRKRAKGPNPLSCKKKQKQPSQASQEAASGGKTSSTKRTRHRKRRKGGSSSREEQAPPSSSS